MTEAWKSQPKKFCTICKCWFADNKVSIQFHEKGLRHQENVKRKLEELSKKGSMDEKIAEFQKHSLARMEEEAVKALNRDLRENPHMAAQYNLSLAKPDAEGVAKGIAYASYVQPVRNSYNSGGSAASSSLEFTAPAIWVETYMPDGQKYYWNTTAGETQWEPPSQSFLTMAEYEDYMRERGAIPQHRAPIYAAQTKMTFPTGGDIPGSSETEDNTNAATDETTESIPQSVTVQPMGPLGKRKIDPYGQWQSVEPRKQDKLPNLGLPTLKPKSTPEVNISKEEGEVQLKFREKTIKKLPIGGGEKSESVGFKKRKFAGTLKNRDDDE